MNSATLISRLSATADVIAKVASQEATDGWSKAGVMIRESLAAGSRYAATFVTPSNRRRYSIIAPTPTGIARTFPARPSPRPIG